MTGVPRGTSVTACSILRALVSESAHFQERPIWAIWADLGRPRVALAAAQARPGPVSIYINMCVCIITSVFQGLCVCVYVLLLAYSKVWVYLGMHFY